MDVLFNEEWLWIVIVGFIVAFVLAFGIGANDVANSFGSSVGARVLSLRQACILGSIFETLGAVLIGTRVSNTIRKGIITVDSYQNGTEAEFLVGNLAALSGSCVWLLAASFLRLPVSATHSIVGATLGFSLVAHGASGVCWTQLAKIISSWFVSPLLSGGMSTLLFLGINKFVLSKDKPLEPGLKLLPVIYALTVGINLFSIFYKGSELLHFNEIPLYGTFILTIGPAIIAAIIVRFVIVPWQRKKITEKCKALALKEEEEGLTGRNMDLSAFCDHELIVHGENKENADVLKKGNSSSKKLPLNVHDTNIDRLGNLLDAVHSKGNLSTSSSCSATPLMKYHATHDQNPADTPVETPAGSTTTSGATTTSNGSLRSDSLDDSEEMALAREKIQEKPETGAMFSFLQVLTAVFGSFAHGGNDVSNAIGPLVALWITATTGSAAQKAPVPIWILLIGGAGISIGLWVMGRRVMKTMGEDLTKITPSSGFCIEVGSAMTVLGASNLGIPISTTHCKVGSIVFVGWFRSKQGVDWKLFRNIVIAWFVTLPVAGGLSAAIMAGLREVV